MTLEIWVGFVELRQCFYLDYLLGERFREF
jgi:hypothetical protein